MPNHLTPAQLALMDKLYWDGKVDREIAEEVGRPCLAIFHWRHRMDYPPNGVPGGGIRTWYAVYRAKTDELVAIGTAKECAKVMGMNENVFRSTASKVKSGKNKKYVFVDVEEDNE